MTEELHGETAKFLALCGLEPGTAILSRLEVLRNMLVEDNRQYNLTRMESEEDFWIKHVCDSAAIFRFFPSEMGRAGNLCDVGSGAGFPAAVIALMAPHIRVAAVESSSKKCAFIAKIAETLGIPNLIALNTNIDEFNRKCGRDGKFDVVTARAFARSEKTYRKTSRLLAEGGTYILYKTPGQSGELCEIRKVSPPDFFWGTTEEFGLPFGMGRRLFIHGSRRRKGEDT